MQHFDGSTLDHITSPFTSLSEKENYLAEKGLLNFQGSNRDPKSVLSTKGTKVTASVQGGDLTPINATMRAYSAARPIYKSSKVVALVCHLAGNKSDLAESVILGEHARESNFFFFSPSRGHIVQVAPTAGFSNADKTRV